MSKMITLVVTLDQAATISAALMTIGDALGSDDGAGLECQNLYVELIAQTEKQLSINDLAEIAEIQRTTDSWGHSH